jgi:hypothetical protein
MSGYAHVRNGSIASFWSSADYFRSSPGNGHIRAGPYKGARRRRGRSITIAGANAETSFVKDSRPRMPAERCRADRPIARSQN